MALTSAQQNDLFKLTVGLFNAAPGSFYTEVEGIMIGSQTPAAAAQVLIGTPAFQAILPSQILTNTQFATKFLDMLVGSTVSAANKAWAVAQMDAKLNNGETQGAVAWWAIDELSKVPTSNADWGTAAATLTNKLDVAKYFTVDKYVASNSVATLQGLLVDVTSDVATVAVAKANATSNAIALTTTVGETVGTAGADTFQAFLANGANTLQSGDSIRGGAGNDTLMADMAAGASAENAIAFSSQSVEKVVLRSQHADTTNNNGDNNVGAAKVAIDAERAVGVNTWENFNSRADLAVEDVRIGASQKTKDITIVMRDTDPGAVDYAVYFDQNSLRAISSASSTINVRVLDTYAVAQGLSELKDSPYGSFTFFYSNDGGATYNKVELASQAMQDALTIDAMVTAMQAQADSKFGAGVVTVAKGTSYTVPDSVTGNTVTGYEISLSTSASISFDTTQAGSGWKATDTVPAISGLYTSYNTATASSTDLVTSTVILDHVGRGSNGGDLIIGGLSTGDTSSSKGVQQFDITVEDTSKLSNILSTNNTLQVVNIVNGTTDVQSDAYVTRTANAGDLYVGVSNDQNSAFPSGPQNYEDSAYGFSDVRVINGAAMTGKLSFTAEMTSNAIGKYVNRVDTASNPAADNVAVAYSGGANNDTMVVDIDTATAASHSNFNVGREDFTFNFSGNGGDDVINVAIDRGANIAGGLAVESDGLIGATEAASTRVGNTEAWYTNQKLNNNITINGGEGADTITKPGAGDTNINGGAGNDTIYADNSGSLEVWAANAAVADNVVSGQRATWVVNTANQLDVGAGQYVLATNEERDLSDLQSSANSKHALYKANLTVTYRGITSKVAVASDNYITTDLHLNQAIKNAISSSAVLSKLVVAQDGPANTLVITSLIDGLRASADLGIAVDVTGVTYSATEQTAMIAAWKAAGDSAFSAATVAAATGGSLATAVVGDIAAITTADIGSFTGTAGDDYYAQLAETGANGRDDSAVNASAANAAMTGAVSLTTSDNKITADAGDDVIVLGTTVGGVAANGNDVAGVAADIASSNDTVIYSGSFGNDTIVNFSADLDVTAGEISFGADVLKIVSYMGTAAITLEGVAAGSTIAANGEIADLAAAGEVGAGVDSEIVVRNIDSTGTAGTADRNDSAASVKLQYTDDATADKGLYVTYDAATNVATLYSVVDGTAASDLTVTLVGSIDFADTTFTTLTLDNFA